MKKKIISAESGYADLEVPRILVTIVFILGLIVTPTYLKYDKQSKLMPILDGLQQSVGEYYIKTKRLPDIEKIPVVAGQEYVDINNKQFRVNLSVLGKDMADKYLLLQPYFDQEHVAWKCSFVGEVYKDEIPALRGGVCQNSKLALAERSLAARLWNFMIQIWVGVVGYVLFIGLTFIFG